MKTILIGSVDSSKIILEEMIKINFPLNMVFSLDEDVSKCVSGYSPIHNIAKENKIPFTKFKKINDLKNIEIIKKIEPDYIFVIGLSQLIKKEMLDLASKGVIGFHPTPLPKMRGRAALVWQVLLGVENTKCSLFFIDEGMDSGDIIAQEEYKISENDYVIDAYNSCLNAFRKLLQKTLKDIKLDKIKRIKQNENEATYLLKRIPEDGEINWDKSIEEIYTLIRATSKPYPGAYSNYDGDKKVIFWRAEVLKNNKYIGIPGQIAKIHSEYIDVVCKDGLLRITEYEKNIDMKLIEGHKFK